MDFFTLRSYLFENIYLFEQANKTERDENSNERIRGVKWNKTCFETLLTSTLRDLDDDGCSKQEDSV